MTDAAATEILVFNPGSSSLKFGVYQMPASAGGAIVRDDVRCLASGLIQPIGPPAAAQPTPGNDGPTVRIRRPGQPDFVSATLAGSPVEAASRVVLHLDELGSGDVARIRAVGCRVVHGGTELSAPAVVSPAVLETLRRVEPLAPLHNPIDVAVLEAVARSLPGIPAVAVFDTAFHATLPPVASTYALPFEISERHGLRRFGFHGISHAYVSGQLLARIGRSAPGTRLITCHLGSGASVCALRDGRSVDTSMGLTPLEGLVMGTRIGDVDPGLVLFLIRTLGLTPDAVHGLLNYQSGLKGLSGVSADLRAIERAAAAGDARAELALEVFAYRVAKYVGAYAVALDGLDAVAFSGGIGEHSAAMRRRICDRLRILGVTLDEDRNRAATGDAEVPIGRADEGIAVWVIPTDEELEIACATAATLAQPG